MRDDGWYARWLFKLLDYEHYSVEDDVETCGQVVINHADRSVAKLPYPDAVNAPWFEKLPESYDAMRKWLREHEDF